MDVRTKLMYAVNLNNKKVGDMTINGRYYLHCLEFSFQQKDFVDFPSTHMPAEIYPK